MGVRIYGWGFRSVVSGTAVAAALALSSFAANSAPLTIDPSNPIDGITWSVTPSDFLHSAYYDGNVTPQSASNIDTVLSGWFNLNLTLVSQADHCGLGGLSCNDEQSTLTYTGPAANVFGIHIGGGEFAFYFTAPITTLALVLSGATGISDVRAFCSLSSCGDSINQPPTETPLPAALPLFGSVIGAGWLAMRRRRKALQASAAA